MPNERPAAWVLVLSALLAATGLALGVLFFQATALQRDWVIGAAIAMAVLGLLVVPSTGRTEFTPAYMVAAALPFIRYEEAGVPVFDSIGAGAAISFGLVATWVARTIRRDSPRRVFLSFIKRSLAFAAYWGGYQFGEASIAANEWIELGAYEPAFLLFTAAVAAFAVEVISSAVFRFEPGGRATVFFAFETARDLPVFVSLVAGGALFGLAFQTIEWWALALAALPYAFAHSAFRRFAETKTAYRQTIKALSQIPEVGGHTDPGHAERTAELAVAIATEMGLRPSEVEWTEYAAFLHDIGRVTLNEPSVLRRGFSENEIAAWGAEIVAETEYLAGVAEVVGRQYQPFRSPGDGGDPDLPVASKIVKIASAYDESCSELGFSPLEAMDRLHRGAAYDYDPEVVAVLRTILNRRGVFHPVTQPA